MFEDQFHLNIQFSIKCIFTESAIQFWYYELSVTDLFSNLSNTSYGGSVSYHVIALHVKAKSHHY